MRTSLGDARPEERTSLALAVSHLAQHCAWGSAAPGVVTLYREALLTFDLSVLDRPCPHPEAHPEIKLRDVPRLARAAGPAEHEGCPSRIAAHVKKMTDYTGGYLGADA